MPKTLKQLAPDKDVVALQKHLSANGYFKDQIPLHGIFDPVTHQNVLVFQMQHVDKNGQPLETDGIVGAKTWWALFNPSGTPQRNRFQPVFPGGLTTTRDRLLALLMEAYQTPVFEVPDGSNRSPDIDGYWGNTGLIGLPWCCAFVSWSLKQALGFYPIQGRHHVGVQKMWRAARRLNMAAIDPKPGDLFIQIKAGGTGHTGFIIGVSPDDQHIYTCEGNCGNRLKIGRRPVSSITHFIDCLKDGQSPDFTRSDFDIAAVGEDTR